MMAECGPNLWVSAQPRSSSNSLLRVISDITALCSNDSFPHQQEDSTRTSNQIPTRIGASLQCLPLAIREYLSCIEISSIICSAVKSEEQFYDPCRDYSAVTRSPSHTWTTEQKIALWLLKERFVISWSDIKLIFHRLFDDELYSFLSPSKAAITSMWYQLKKQRFNPTGSWSSIERALELKAAELGMVLEKRIASTSEQRNDPLESFLRSNFTEEEDDSDQTLLGDEYSDPRTPSKRSRNRPASGALEFRSPVSMKSTVGLRRREAEITIPKIGFRT